GSRQIKAFNLCDGSRSQSEIASQSGIAQGNLSRTLARWISAGIIYEVGDSRDTKLLHVYPILAGKNKSRGSQRGSVSLKLGNRDFTAAIILGAGATRGALPHV